MERGDVVSRGWVEVGPGVWACSVVSSPVLRGWGGYGNWLGGGNKGKGKGKEGWYTYSSL